MVAGRRFVEGHQALALDPFEVRGSQACAAAKSRSLGLAAHRAMAVLGLGQRTRDLVSHATAQATPTDHARLHDAFLAIARYHVMRAGAFGLVAALPSGRTPPC